LARRRICTVLLCLLFTSLACAAADSAPRFGLSIRAGLPLDEALQELAHQSGIQLVFFSRITAGRSAPQVSGEYTLEAAMGRLLDGSDLTFRKVNARTIEIRQGAPRPAQARLARSTRSTAADDSMQEVQVIATAEQLVASRVPTRLHDIPQSISVISAEQIRQQNSFELGDVMGNTPGIAARRVSAEDETAYSRGFQINSYHVDGGGALRPSITALSFYQGNPDLSEFDRIEVLRGSDALFTGNGSPGGTVSLVRKRPQLTPSLAMSATAGSWNNYRVELDATGPLTDEGSLRGRVDAVYGTRDYFFDRAHLDRKKIFAALEYDFTPVSTLTAGGSYQWDDSLPLQAGLPLYQDGSDPHLPRSTGLTFDWSFANTRLSQVYLQFRQQFADNWLLKFNASAGRTNLDYGAGWFTSTINRRTQVLPAPSASFGIRPDRFTLGTFDATLTGELDLFGLREVIALGGDFTRVRGKQFSQNYFGFGQPLANVLTFDPAAYPDPRGTQPPDLVVDSREELEQYGAFLSLQVDVLEALSVTGGARISTDDLRVNGSLFFQSLQLAALSNRIGSSNVITPYAALLYRINERFSWYASYADVYQTLLGPPRTVEGEAIGPSHGTNIETGIKGAWRDGALNVSLAAYTIQQRHAPVRVEISPLPSCCFVSGNAHSRGIDLEADGELATGWLIGSGYTYNLNETADGSIPATSTPRHQLKIWTSKTLTGALSRWTVGGSLRAQTAARGSLLFNCDATLTTCVPTEAAGQSAYAVLDLRAAFEIDANWEVALSVNNVLDKDYYLSQNTPELNVWYGEPRNFMLRFDARY
jgi:outer-membrane receptor for ferric coprogen and ferric-rhodotorulic acid